MSDDNTEPPNSDELEVISAAPELEAMSGAADAEVPEESSKARAEERLLVLEQIRIKADAERTGKKLALGWLGHVLGDKDHAPVFVQSITISLLVLILSGGLLWLALEDPTFRPQIFQVFQVVIVAALGYWAGSRGLRS